MYLRATVLVMLAATCAAAEGHFGSATCDATPYQRLLPEVVAPMAGQSPIWLVTGASPGSGLWIQSECGVKTLWVVARGVEGHLTVQGKRLDGPGDVTFRTSQAEQSSVLIIPAAALDRGVRPDGASPEILERYAFWPSLVFYTSVGCWELTARIGDQQVRIVQNLTASVDTACEPAQAPH